MHMRDQKRGPQRLMAHCLWCLLSWRMYDLLPCGIKKRHMLACLHPLGMMISVQSYNLISIRVGMFATGTATQKLQDQLAKQVQEQHEQSQQCNSLHHQVTPGSIVVNSI